MKCEKCKLKTQIITLSKNFEIDNFEKVIQDLTSLKTLLHSCITFLSCWKILLFSLDLSNICIWCHCCITIFKWKYLFEYWILMPAILMCGSVLYSDSTCHQMIYKLPTIILAVWPHSALSVSRTRVTWLISGDACHSVKKGNTSYTKVYFYVCHLIRNDNKLTI